MCSRVVCRTCNKITYSGCGNHLDQVFAGVPESERCTCSAQQGSGASTWSLFGRG